MEKFSTLALLGLGRAGLIHSRNIFLSQRCKLKYALDISEENLLKFSAQYSDSTTLFLLMSDYEMILNDPNLDAIVICTSTDSHEELIMKALMQGKSVFCEKPISNSYQGIETVYNLANKNSLVLHCSMNRRYDPAIKSMFESVQGGHIGKVHIIKTCSRDGEKPSIEYLKKSGGIFHDCAVHDVDMVLWLLGNGSRPKTVFAASVTEDPEIAAIGDAETAMICITFEDNTMAVVDLSRQSTYGYDQRVEVHGSRGMLQSLNQRPHHLKSFCASGLSTAVLKMGFSDRYADSYINSLNDFLDCLQESRPSPVKGEELLMLARVLDMAKLSNSTNELQRF